MSRSGRNARARARAQLRAAAPPAPSSTASLPAAASSENLQSEMVGSASMSTTCFFDGATACSAFASKAKLLPSRRVCCCDDDPFVYPEGPAPEAHAPDLAARQQRAGAVVSVLTRRTPVFCTIGAN
eukprot:CAMPEP_0179059860 /NCGR_PEP_ID=MMETSP0796-20121207/25570_1 /TAXON_ID=73915 /ORGANISM="Pyrodinium bahamense, Strain pbaha01" /LENGTH=126 /DNA_ID=CAMNT_0020756629 /DNA_START=233 /DNA_END=609 /DNA_ORIENTATION=-